jgi:2-C-methyl-D-erythritol 4-phosphate cytidylyltransferase
MRYWLVMPAAGAGRRFGAPLPKQYAPLEGRTVIEWALSPFLADARCAEAVVALAPDDEGWARVAPRLRSPDTLVPHAPPRPPLSVVAGGEQRSHSVRRALSALEGRAAANDWVLVHDAVRPCLEAADLERLLGALCAHPLGGLLAVPAADTLKRAQERATDTAPPPVAQTLDRAGVWRALTPQMFRYRRLCAALDQAHAAGRSPSDEAQALEWLGEHPLLIEGAATNLKITAAADLVLAAALLRSRRAACAAPGGTAAHSGSVGQGG